MRLLSVIHGPVYGGAHNQLIALAGPLAERGWETVALLPEEGEEAIRRVRAAGVEVVPLGLHRLRRTVDPRVHARTAASAGREVAAMRRLLREREVDLVQVHGDTNGHGAVAAHREGRAVVWQLYDTVTPPPLRRLTMPLVVRLADAITTWGHGLARGYPGATTLGERLVTVFPPVDARRFAPDPARRAAARAELGVPDDAFLVGTVGNRNPTKGHDDLARALGLLRRRRPETVGRVLGAPSPPHAAHEAGVRRTAEELGLDATAFDLVDPGTRVDELMPGFDVLCMSSVPRSEGIPTVIFEAMACGLPVVTTRVGAVEEVVEEGRTGWIVPPQDPAALAAALEPLAADPALRARAGEAGRAAVLERYDLGRCAERHLMAYEVALQHRRLRRRRDGERRNRTF